MSAHHRLPILVAAFVLVACFDPPELDDLPPPLADLGPIDTWAPFEEAGPPSGDDPEGPSDPSAEETPDPEVEVDPALAQLRIGEVLPDPEGKDGGPDSPEFVEILNPGPLPINLAGLVVQATSWPTVSASDLGLAEVELAVGGLLVIRRWANDADSSLAAVEITDDVVWTGFLHSGGLRNGDGTVTLEAGPMLIDQLVYGPEPGETTDGWSGPPVSAPGSNTSMCRLDDPDDDTAENWVHCAPSPGASTAGASRQPEPDPIPFGAIQIVEVAANPPGPASDEKPYEYVEVVNMTETPLELAGCRIGDDADITAPGVDPLEYVSGDGGCESPTCLAPGARALIVGQGFLGETGDALVLATDDSTIADGGLTNTEPVVLWDSSDAMISSYRIWRDPAGDPLPTDEQPLHRLDPYGADDPQNWISAPATPGG